MISKINRIGEDKSNIINNYQNKDNNNFLENELSIIIKKIKKELNIYKKLFKNTRLDFIQIHNEFEIENNKYKINYNKLLVLEKDIELIQKNIAKLKKKKIYIISSILKFKKLFTSDNLEAYKYILNIGLNGPKNNYDFIEAIKMDDEEFNSYLNFMENYYANLEKENNLHFFKFKIEVNDLVNEENIDFPIDKLIFYLHYIIQIIENTNKLNEKLKELKEIEIIKNEQNIKIKDLEKSKLEKINLLAKMNDYMELLRNLIERFNIYQQNYKNNLISKELLNKKMRKLQMINFDNFYIEKMDIIEKNNFLINKSITINSPFQSKIDFPIRISKRRNKKKIQISLASKSQIISRNIPTDYFYKSEGTFSKKYNLEKNEITFNDMISSISLKNKDIKKDENISEDSEHESPISTINITKRKRSLKDSPISKKNNNKNIINESISIDISNKKDLNNINNNCGIKITDSQKLYCKKKPFININSKNKILSANPKSKNDKEKSKNKINDLSRNKYITLNQKENSSNNKCLPFKKKINGKKFFINKNKLFNKNFSKTIMVNETQLNIRKEPNLISETKSRNNKVTKNEYTIEKCDSINNKYIHKIEHNIIFNFHNYNKDIQYKDSLKTIKEELKHRKYSYINKNKLAKNNKKFAFKSEVPNQNCCVSCL